MSSWSRWNSWRYCGQYLNKYWWNFVRYMYVYYRVFQCVFVFVWESMCRRAHSISTVNIISLKMWSHLYGTWLALPKGDNSSQKITLLQVMKVSMIGLLPLSARQSPCLPACLAIFVSAHLCHKLCWTECDTHKIIKIKIENQIRKPKPTATATATAKPKCILEKPHVLYDLRSRLITEKKELWAPHISACFRANQA